MEDWYNVNRDDLIRVGAGSIYSHFGSRYKLLSAFYPEYQMSSKGMNTTNKSPLRASSLLFFHLLLCHSIILNTYILFYDIRQKKRLNDTSKPEGEGTRTSSSSTYLTVYSSIV